MFLGRAVLKPKCFFDGLRFLLDYILLYLSISASRIMPTRKYSWDRLGPIRWCVKRQNFGPRYFFLMFHDSWLIRYCRVVCVPKPSRRPPGSSLRNTILVLRWISTPTRECARRSPSSPARNWGIRSLGEWNYERHAKWELTTCQSSFYCFICLIVPISVVLPCTEKFFLKLELVNSLFSLYVGFVQFHCFLAVSTKERLILGNSW